MPVVLPGDQYGEEDPISGAASDRYWLGPRISPAPYVHRLPKQEVSVYFTSTLYPITDIAGLDIPQLTVRKGRVGNIVLDAMDASQLSVLAGSLRTILQTYSMLPEAIDASQLTVLGGILDQILLTYTMLPEAVDVSQLTVRSGSLEVKLISYLNYYAEAMQVSQLSVLSGSLT